LFLLPKSSFGEHKDEIRISKEALFKGVSTRFGLRNLEQWIETPDFIICSSFQFILPKSSFGEHKLYLSQSSHGPLSCDMRMILWLWPLQIPFRKSLLAGLEISQCMLATLDSDSHDDDSMPMCIYNSQDDGSMPMYRSNSHSDAFMGRPC
jgi:hypothetical protein